MERIMNEFTASNGGTVRVIGTTDDGARTMVDVHRAYNLREGGRSTAYLIDDQVEALREFFRAEEDERLGRFRDPNTPGYVAYDRGEGYVRVVREADGTSEVYIRQDVEQPGGLKPAVVARAFFDAHPEPKPWHDAKPGEVWVLDANEFSGPHYVEESSRYTGGIGFRHVGTRTRGPGIIAPYIKGARRIWPEATS